LQAVGIHALFFVSLLSFLGADDIPTVNMFEFYGMMIVMLPLSWSISRIWLKQYRNHGYNFSRVVIVGTNPTAKRLGEALASDAGYGFRIMGFCDTARITGFKGKYIGTIDELDAYVKREHVDEIYYTLSGEKEEVLRKVMQIAEYNVVKFYYVPRISQYVGRKFVLTNIGEVPVLALRHTPLSNVINRMLKRCFDFVFSSVVLLLSPIVFIPVAIAVKMSSPGPVFFKQMRTGYRGRTFSCWKFRTMRVNAGSDTLQATEHDPRKTKVGDFLRRTSIDELPQFINVWLGQMSVVGPRPHMLKHTEDYNKLVSRYMVRHEVKPGITGWAQVLGLRGQTDELWKMEKRVQADVWYIENWSFMLDLKIIVKTIINGFKGDENAF
ncbi:MAG: undecaprenyl-phosphate glucose phosphotransferase, partial [Muribaculaceae bacterium]|nr:undecaprenyl-phosphate glucose phosphotransferase [Muribaculaceae bacterium]